MSSSTSSSDAFAGQPGDWTGFIRWTICAALGALAASLAAIVALDPYDTGRFGLWPSTGVRQQGPRTANASRGRDPQFESAIIGNSHVQLLSPARLSEATGQRFVSLIVPGTRPPEQLAILDWFASRPRPRLRSIVIGVDTNWCTGDPGLPLEHPFPFWLYAPSLADYLKGSLRLGTLEEIGRRVEYLVGSRKRQAAPDGYWDYEADYLRLGYGSNPALRERLERRIPIYASNPDLIFPAADRLRSALAKLPPSLKVVLVHSPAYVSGLPEPGSPLAAVAAACKQAFAAVAAGRPGTSVVDWLGDRPQARDPALWFDSTHYRRPLAEMIEADIAAAVR